MQTLIRSGFCFFKKASFIGKTYHLSFLWDVSSRIICTKNRTFKEYMSDSFTNYNYVGNTKVSVSIKKTYAIKCTLSEILLVTEISKSFSVF